MGTCQILISMLDSILGQNFMAALQLMRCPFVSPGEKWHYSPLATRLAQSGIVACVVSYTLYPQTSAQDMVAELSQALTWTLDNIRQHGGDPDQVLPHYHLWCLLPHSHKARSVGSICLCGCL